MYFVKVFGIRNSKECRSGRDALKTYAKDGPSTACNGNFGAWIAYTAFMFEDEKAPPLSPAKIVTPPKSGAVPGGFAFTLTCGTQGYPFPTVVWTKNGQDLPDDPNFMVNKLTIYFE